MRRTPGHSYLGGGPAYNAGHDPTYGAPFEADSIVAPKSPRAIDVEAGAPTGWRIEDVCPGVHGLGSRPRSTRAKKRRR